MKEDKKGLKSPLARAIYAVVVILVIVIGLFVVMGVINKKPLLKKFDDSKIAVVTYSATAVREGFDDIEELKSARISTVCAGSIADDNATPTGYFLQFDEGADEVYDVLKDSPWYCVRKGDYIFVFRSDDIDENVQKIIDKLPGKQVTNK